MFWSFKPIIRAHADLYFPIPELTNSSPASRRRRLASIAFHARPSRQGASSGRHDTILPLTPSGGPPRHTVDGHLCAESEAAATTIATHLSLLRDLAGENPLALLSVLNSSRPKSPVVGQAERSSGEHESGGHETPSSAQIAPPPLPVLILPINPKLDGCD
jgi:hypothetical protein